MSNKIFNPKGRITELIFTINTVFQFIKAFRTFHFVTPCITFFGSARIEQDNEYYKLTRKMAFEVGKLGYSIMTGGGPGIMEAANRGAQEANAISLGCNIILDREQKPNIYLDKFVEIKYFFIRKEILRKYSKAFVVFPGGFGTLDEFFETITLIQTKKINNFPIILFGKYYYQGLIKQLNMMKEWSTIDQNELELILFTDSVEEAIEHIKKFSVSPEEVKTFNPIKILFEKSIKK